MWKPSMGARPATGMLARGRMRLSSAAIVVLPVPGGPVSPRTRTCSPESRRWASSSAMRAAIWEAGALPASHARPPGSTARPFMAG